MYLIITAITTQLITKTSGIKLKYIRSINLWYHLMPLLIFVTVAHENEFQCHWLENLWTLNNASWATFFIVSATTFDHKNQLQCLKIQNPIHVLINIQKYKNAQLIAKSGLSELLEMKSTNLPETSGTTISNIELIINQKQANTSLYGYFFT